MGMNPHANGGLLLEPLRLPDFRDYAVEVKRPGRPTAEATRILGRYLRDVMKLNLEQRNFRMFGPDETASNRLDAVLEVTGKTWEAATLPVDEHLAPDGRVMEVLSEHMCQGWLEGYLLTGRHGFFSCYEAFIHIVDSMFNQHAKWLKTTRAIPWRQPIASLNYLLTSHVWRQDHNGFSPPGPRLHRSRGQQEGRRGPDLSAARCQYAALGGRPLPSQPQLRERDRRRQAAGTGLAGHGRRGAPLHHGAGHLGLGRATMAGRPMSSWRARGMCRRWRPWPRSPCCGKTCPICASGW